MAWCTADDLRHYMLSLLEALAFMHEKGIIHRDVKPNNFLYCHATRQACLTDFGLAEFVSEQHGVWRVRLILCAAHALARSARSTCA